jgi:MoxR-like ATPase
MMRLRLGYPTEKEEVQIFDRQAIEHPLKKLEAVLRVEEAVAICDTVPLVYVHPNIKDYAARIVRATRHGEDVKLGASPRATLHLIRASQALALLTGLAFVTPDVVKAVGPSVLGHRLVLKPHAQIRGASGHEVVRSLLNQIEVPVEFRRGA